MNHASQNYEILEYMKAGNSIAPLEALKLFNCWALSSRISDLHKLGYNIISVIKKGENGKRYARYHLEARKETQLEMAV
jgi:hypothetical protein